MVASGSGATGWSTWCNSEADESFAAGCSSGEPSAPSDVSDGLAGSSDELLQGKGDVDSFSGEVAASLGKAGDPSAAGKCSIMSLVSLGKSGDLSSAGSSFDELMEVPGKADLEFLRPSVEFFLSTLLLSFMKAGFVVLGDQ